jgi:isoquinoline 1-oxidoreductase
MRDDEYVDRFEESLDAEWDDSGSQMTVDRRDFMKLVGGGVVVFVTLSGTSVLTAEPWQGRGRGYPTDFNAYLRIGGDGRVTVFSGKVEIGQGVMTSLAQMAAEDLGIALDSIDMIMGDTDLCPYDSGTYGSLTTRMFGPAVRAAAATAREVLMTLASEHLGVPKNTLQVENGVVFQRGDRQTRVTYAELADGKRIERTIGEEAVLKSVREFTVMGQSPMRLDAVEKVTGKAQFAGDIRLPGMLYAKILRPPSHAATLRSVDTSAAERVAGVTIVNEDDLVAALHEDPEQAEQALELIRADFDVPAPEVDNDTIHDHLLSLDPGGRASDERGSMEVGERASTSVFEETYLDNYFAHAPMEPHTATATVENGRVTLWVSTQSPFGDRSQVARALGLEEEDVRVLTPYVGGGFGGKTSNQQAVEAARLTRATGKPVQVAWSRAEEFFYDSYRPAAIVKVRSGVDDQGTISLWDYHVYFAGTRGADQYYDVPNSQIVAHSGGWRGAPGTHPFATGAWRAPGASTNHFGKECQIDIMAAHAGIDPVEFRLRHVSEPRLRSAIETVAERFGWQPASSPSGRGLGVACGVDAGTYVAHIAEVEVNRSTGQVQVRRVFCAQDMGIVVNPDGALMQMEGCITMGLGYSLSEDLRFRGGEVLTKNFDTYELPRFSQLPEIECILVRNDELSPQGGGEPAIVSLGAAIANAIHDATGARLFQLPMTPARVRDAIETLQSGEDTGSLRQIEVSINEA